MISNKTLSGLRARRLALVMVIFVGLNLPPLSFSQGTAGEKAEQAQKPAAAPSFGVEEPKGAADLFREARKLAPTDPIGAGRLYERGFMLKPDAWTEKRELAALYEKQQQWNLALGQYEAINRATESAESFTDLVRMLERAGYPRAAATAARKAYTKHPWLPRFIFLAGEILQKYGAQEEALAALQEYQKIAPGDGKALLLIGSIYEQAGRLADALRAYLSAEKLMKNDQETALAVKRLRSGAAFVEGLTIFLAPGFNVEKNGLSHAEGGQRVEVTVKTSGNPAKLALEAASEMMPPGLFTAENLANYEQSRKMREKLVSIDPATAKTIDAMAFPFYSTGDFPGMTGAKKALLSTSESARPGMESAVAIAVPHGGRIFIFLWRASMPAPEGEKTLTRLIGQTVWPF